MLGSIPDIFLDQSDSGFSVPFSSHVGFTCLNDKYSWRCDIFLFDLKSAGMVQGHVARLPLYMGILPFWFVAVA